jgi:hypothetical protein
MAIQELSKEEISVVAGGLVLRLNLVGTLGKILKGVISTVGRLLRKLGL